MSEVLICRPWEPTGPWWAFRTTPSLPSEEDSVGSLNFGFSSIEEFFCWLLVGIKWEPQRGSLLLCEAGECNVAKWGHGCPCGQQPLDEINGNCAQGTKTSRIWNCFWSADCWIGSQCRTGPQSVSSFLLPQITHFLFKSFLLLCKQVWIFLSLLLVSSFSSFIILLLL